MFFFSLVGRGIAPAETLRVDSIPTDRAGEETVALTGGHGRLYV